MKKMMTAALAACLAASLAGCTGAQAQNGESAADEATERTSQAGSSDMTAALEGLDLDFSKRDTDPSYDEAAATKVSLADDAISVDGSGAEAEGSQLTVTAAGTYVVTGELGNGGITVAAGDEDKVQLVLSNTVIHNENGPAIFVDNADKVFITLAEGTENSLTDGAEYQLTDEDDNRDACVFSRDDITFNGSGKLTVNGAYKHAICSKDDLVIAGGQLNITSVEDALTGKDAVKVTGSDLQISAGDDAVHTEGYIYMKDGNVEIATCYEGYEGTQIVVDGGTHKIYATDDALNAALGDTDESSTADQAANGESASAATAPDGAAPQGDMQGGPFADGEGSPDGDMSEEGAFAGGPRGMGGTGDMGDMTPPDGVDGAPDQQMDGMGDMGGKKMGGADMDGKQMGGGFDGGMAQSSSSCLIQINGGTLELQAETDGVDSNGNVQINGGTVMVSGPDAGMDGSLDYDLAAEVNGGTLLFCGSVGSTNGLDSGEQAVAYGQVSGSAGSQVELLDANGTVLASFAPGIAFTSVLASSPEAATGNELTVSVDGQLTQLTLGDIMFGSMGGSMGGKGMR